MPMRLLLVEDRLRRKIERQGGLPFIHAVRAHGYVPGAVQ